MATPRYPDSEDDSHERIAFLDIGAGETPHPDATHTLDVRTDLVELDFPGVDIGTDEWPLADGSVEQAVCEHVLEDVPRAELDHVFDELHRVLAPGAQARLVVPHLGAYSEARNPKHVRGFTLELADHLGSAKGTYWTAFDWEAEGWVQYRWPVCLRPSLRVTRQLSDSRLAFELLKVPFSDAEVIVELHMPETG